MQVIGYYVKFETECFNPPLCVVLSEHSARLLCFPFADQSGNDAIDCLVLPPIPLFLKVDVTDTPELTSYVVNRYLLALLLLWTKPNNGLYHVKEGHSRPKIQKQYAVKKTTLRSHIQTHAEKTAEELCRVREANKRFRALLHKQDAKEKEMAMELDAKEKELDAKEKEMAMELDAKEKEMAMELDAKEKEMAMELDAKEKEMAMELDAKEKELDAKEKEMAMELDAKEKELASLREQLDAVQEGPASKRHPAS